jgi:hypothetical protein
VDLYKSKPVPTKSFSELVLTSFTTVALAVFLMELDNYKIAKDRKFLSDQLIKPRL